MAPQKAKKPQPPDEVVLAAWIRKVVPWPGAPIGDLTQRDLAAIATANYKMPIKVWRIAGAVKYDRQNYAPGASVLIGAPWRLSADPDEITRWAGGEMGILHTWLDGYRCVTDATQHLSSTAQNPALAHKLRRVNRYFDNALAELEDAVEEMVG